MYKNIRVPPPPLGVRGPRMMRKSLVILVVSLYGIRAG